MYISLYGLVGGTINHITNLINVEIEYTARLFDFDSFSAKGISDVDFSNALFYVVYNDDGSFIEPVSARTYTGWTGMVKNIKRENENSNLWSFKGEDFRELLNTEVIIDYTQEPLSRYSLTLNSVFKKVTDLIDKTNTFPLTISFGIPSDTTDTSSLIDYRGTYLIKNAYTFLRTYLSYYGYYISPKFYPQSKSLEFSFNSVNTLNRYGYLKLKLKDFTYTRTSNDLDINSAVATITWNTTKEVDGVTVTSPRPVLPTKTYYLGKDNQIYESLPSATNRLYPIKARIFEEEMLANAQFNAIYELANSRYPENIQITSDNVYEIIDFDYDVYLFRMISAYDDNGNYKDLPVTEMQYKITPLKKDIVVKLGFKKMLLTQIIKGN